MKKPFIFAIFSLFVIVLISTTSSAQDTNELKARIEKINKEMQQAMVSGNTTAALSYYASDAVSLPNYGKMATGIEAIQKSNEGMMSGGSKILSFETTIISVNTCNKFVSEIGTYQMSMSIPGMPDPMKDAGKYVTIWEQQSDGSLKIKVEIWNTDNYPMGGN
jgi:ketosteroid isomerase-like protein